MTAAFDKGLCINNLRPLRTIRADDETLNRQYPWY